MAAESLEAYPGMNYEIAEAIAPSWERRRAEIERVAAPGREWMLRELGPRAGDTVLELAAGAGDTGFEAAALVGESGRLISSDLSPAMLEAARRRGAELGVENVEYRLIDAERIDLEYVQFVADTAVPVAMVLRGLAEADRQAVTAQAEAALERFAGESGYRIPGVVLGAVGR